MIPTLDEVESARKAIGGTAFRTPLTPLNADSGATRIYLKLESLQPIGSFKLRGASNAMSHLSESERAKGVMTASAGNMAQGVAYCARQLGIPCTVVSPETAPKTKIEAVKRLGGQVVLAPFDVWWKTFEERRYPGIDATFVHAFDDPHVMAGNGTIGLEILEDLPDIDAVVIPWGGGGLATGIASVIRARKPNCRIYAAEVETASPLSVSWKAGSPQTVPYTPSFVDGIASKSVFPQMYERARKLLDGVLVAKLNDVASAVRLLAERNRIVAEGAGATPVACALAGGAGVGNVVCIVSGGNIDASRLAEILTGKNQ